MTAASQNGRIHPAPRENGALTVEAAAPQGLELVPTGRLSEMEMHVRELLELVGEDPDRDGLVRTPHRVAKMYGELLEGYGKDLETVINGALFDVDAL